MKKVVVFGSAAVLTAFGLLTLFMSTSVIFDLFGIREKEGNYVLFVVWANFICGLLYLASAYGFVKGKQWLTKLLSAASLILIGAYAGLFAHIQMGGIYEIKTVKAMAFRITFTLVFAFIAHFFVTKKQA